MVRALLLLGAAASVAGIIGVNFGWRWVFAPLLGWALFRWIVGGLRSLVHDAKHADAEASDPTPVGTDERTLFWCEECGTEVVLIVRGTSRAPSHCGQRMHERTEILRT